MVDSLCSKEKGSYLTSSCLVERRWESILRQLSLKVCVHYNVSRVVGMVYEVVRLKNSPTTY